MGGSYGCIKVKPCQNIDKKVYIPLKIYIFKEIKQDVTISIYA